MPWLLYPEGEIAISIEQEAEWGPEPV